MTAGAAPVVTGRRGWALGVLVVLEVAVGALAVFGGVGLIRDGMGMPVEWLSGTPFASWTWPGVFLLLVVAAPMLAAAGAELARAPWARVASVCAGVAQVAWIVAQVMVLQHYSVLQPVFAAVGLLIIGLARRSS